MGFYVGLIMYPHPTRLSLLHDFDISHTLIDPPTTLLCGVAIAATLLGAVWFAKKEPLLAFSVLWFFGNLAIESSVVSLEIIFEHRTYLPSMLVCLFVVALLYRHAPKPALVTSLLIIVSVVFSSWTYQRNELWKDELAFWKDCTQKAHHDVRAHHSLGNAYLKKNRFDDSIKAYEKALTIAPDYLESLIGLGHALREKGDLIQAVSVHKQAIDMAPKNGASYNHLGVDYLEQNKIDLAVETFQKAVALTPFSYRSYNNLGLAYARTGNILQAIRMYERAIAIRPDFASAYNNLGTLFLNTRESQKAGRFLQRAIALDPLFADAHSNLGLALIHSEQFDKGIQAIKTALQLEPCHEDATFNLARAFELTKNYQQAVDQYRNSIRLNPRDVEAHFKAGFIYLDHLKDTKQAVSLFKRALSLDPGYYKAEKVKRILSELESRGKADA
jgi:tetratricopeptide (TPR) repeat protein